MGKTGYSSYPQPTHTEELVLQRKRQPKKKHFTNIVSFSSSEARTSGLESESGHKTRQPRPKVHKRQLPLKTRHPKRQLEKQGSNLTLGEKCMMAEPHQTLAVRQSEDRFCSQLLNELSDPRNTKNQQFLIRDHVLYHLWLCKNTRRMYHQVVVPADERKSVLHQFHGAY